MVSKSATIKDDTRSVVKKAFFGGSWLAMFRVFSQVISWVATIVVARILVPEDYGLMEMATILTGYFLLFSELGLGAAIIQKETVTDEELSSLFWFIIGWGIILTLLSMLLAYPTVAIFQEERILRITQASAFLFFIGAFLIIPLNLLTRELRFKEYGFMDTCAIIVSCISMVIFASLGFGVWSLILGHIIREITRLIMLSFIVKWRPKLHFDRSEIGPFLKFGVNLAIGNSLRYVYTKSDRFFGGKMMGSVSLGYYAMALQLASIPTDKLVAMVNSVAMPVLSRYQKDSAEFNNLFIKLINIIASVIFPAFIGGYFVADILIPLILGDKWLPIVWPFRLLCISQLLVSISSTCSVGNLAQGRPNWLMYLSFAYFLVMPVSFYYSAGKGLDFIVLPWLTVYPVVAIVYTIISLRKFGIRVRDYLSAYIHPACGSTIMIGLLCLYKYLYYSHIQLFQFRDEVYLTFAIVLGGASYLLYIIVFDPKLIVRIKNLRKKD